MGGSGPGGVGGESGSGGLDPGAEFAIRIDYVKVGTTKSDGSSWDVGGGAPDLFVCIASACTPACSDSFECAWTRSDGVLIDAGLRAVFTGAELAAGVTMTVWDEDLSVHDRGGDVPVMVTTASASGWITGPVGVIEELQFTVIPQ